MKKFIYFTALLLIFSCSSDSNQIEIDQSSKLVEGSWLLNFKLTSNNFSPVNFNLSKLGESYLVEFINGDEKISVKDVTIEGNKITINDPVFNTWFEGEIINSTTIEGNWFKDSKKYKIPFEAKHGKSERFPKPEALTASTSNGISGKWEVDFSKGNPDDHYKAIGQFTQDGNWLSGTFMTETGDYRFLQGNFYNDSAYLSCFDGAHLFLFKAQLRNDSLFGTFWSGTHWEEPWVAFRNEAFELTNPDSLTFLKEGYDKLSFSFPDLNGNNVSLDDDKYQGKVVIVNIMGPWCPNCKDETAYLTQLYKNNKDNGLEIIALSFDKSEDYEVAKQTAAKIKKHFGADYDFLIAGKANKIEAARALPMLNHVMSYPTTIFIDRAGTIRKIRTGFYGPGTGNYYDRYVEQTNDFVAKLLAE